MLGRRLVNWINGALIKGPNSTSARDFNRSNLAIASNPATELDDVDTCIRLGRAALAAGHVAAATAHYRDALLLDANNPDHHAALAYVLTEQGRHEEAWPHLDEAMRLNPEDPDIHFQRGNFQMDVGELSNARRCYGAALALRPDYAEVHSNLGHALVREGLMAEAIASFESALKSDPGHLPAHSNLLWALSFQLDGMGERYLREARGYGEKVLALARPYRDWISKPGQAGSHEVLRVGLVSGDFRQHPVGVFLEGVLKRLNPENVELAAYSMNPQDDPLTETIKGHFSAWTPIMQMSDEETASKIHADGIDILIDLAGHSAYNRLPVFAWKPAPLQVTWLGYLASTGVPGMDYLLADPVSVPDHERGQFTEQVWHLPHTFNCYTPPAEHPKLAVAAPPALCNGYVTFGCFQRLNKLSDTTLALWGRVLNALPQARLYLRNEGMNSEAARGRLLKRMADVEIAPARVTFGGRIHEREDYLSTYADVDIVLDTFPYPGTTTTCEALWMGVPTVTLARGGMLGRIGASLLTCAGLAEWVAWSEDDYVALALRQGSDIERLARLRTGLRQQVAATALFDAGRFAPQLEEALLAMWKRRPHV